MNLLTDDIAKNIYKKWMNGEDLADEEIQILLGSKETETTRMKCKSCGFEEESPTWVLSEAMELDRALVVKNQ